MRSDMPADATIGRDGMRAARALRDEGEGCAMRASLREISSVTTDATGSGTYVCPTLFCDDVITAPLTSDRTIPQYTVAYDKGLYDLSVNSYRVSIISPRNDVMAFRTHFRITG